MSLNFDNQNYTIRIVTVDHESITFRAYENLIYVAKPVEPGYQILNLYVPEIYFEGGAVGPFTARTAPIFMPITVGGYMPGAPAVPGEDRNGGKNAAFVALSKGYVVAAPGARGRKLQNPDGRYTGTAPACIVDLKAAVRYLRYNKARIPGDTEKIISNGTSAGGALSSLLGATGNHQDYEPYLTSLGAAQERDDILAASCYCPITNLENADSAYEWMFGGIYAYTFRDVQGMMSPEQIRLSEEVKAYFLLILILWGLSHRTGPS